MTLGSMLDFKGKVSFTSILQLFAIVIWGFSSKRGKIAL